jgi:hypothetical protein
MLFDFFHLLICERILLESCLRRAVLRFLRFLRMPQAGLDWVRQPAAPSNANAVDGIQLRLSRAHGVYDVYEAQLGHRLSWRLPVCLLALLALLALLLLSDINILVFDYSVFSCRASPICDPTS